MRITNTARETIGSSVAREQACKEAAESVYGQVFEHSVRPEWLRSPETGRLLTLDLYCGELGVAIQINGPQHYKFIPFFHRNDPEQFEASKRKDEYRLELCTKNGVRVITVPYTVDIEDMEKYILLGLTKSKL